MNPLHPVWFVRTLALTATVAAVGCVAEAPTEATPATPTEQVPAAVVERALTPAGGYLNPAWSPDGSQVSFSGPGSRGLFAVAVEGGSVRSVAGDEVSGFRHHWAGDPARIVCPARGSKPALIVQPDSGAVREEPDRAEGVWIERDDVMVRTAEGVVGLTRGEDRFLDPQLSPDGDSVAFVGLVSGVHVVQIADGDIRHLGPGTRPTWTPDSRTVVFERTVDDGHTVTGADIWAWHDGESWPLTATADALELHPAVSPDGRQLAFVRDGAVWIAPLSEVAP